MPQMFDWIFFAIILPPPILLLWDLLRNQEAPVKRMTSTGSGMASSSVTKPPTTAVRSGAGILDSVGTPAETTAQRDANMGTTR